MYFLRSFKQWRPFNIQMPKSDSTSTHQSSKDFIVLVVHINFWRQLKQSTISTNKRMRNRKPFQSITVAISQQNRRFFGLNTNGVTKFNTRTIHWQIFMSIEL